VFDNIKITLHYSVYMHTSSEEVRISDDAERVQSVSYSYIRSLSGLCTAVFLWEGKRNICLGPLFSTVMSKVSCFQRGPTATVKYVMYKHSAVAAQLWAPPKCLQGPPSGDW